MDTSPDGPSIEKLKAKRGAQRGRNTRIANEVGAALEKSDVTVDELATLLERMEASNNKLDRVNEELEPLLPAEGIEDEYSRIAEYEDHALQAMASLKCAMKKMNAAATTTTAPGPTSSTASSCSEDRARQHEPEQVPPARNTYGIKLQKLDLHTFSGDMLSWQPFWEQYLHAVHENPSLTPTEKFHYLRSRLSGQAAAAIAGLQTTEACYKDAVELLTKRFGDRKRIEQQYLSKLRLLDQVKSSNDVKGLRRMYDYVLGNVRGLQALGVSPLTYSAMMCDVLLKALPADIVVDYHRSMKQAARAEQASGQVATESSELELTQMLDFLAVEVESRERCDPLSSSHGNTNRNARNRRHGNKVKLATAAVLHAGTRETPQCVFCKSQKHTAEDCKATLSLDEKKVRLSRDMRCFNCTMKGHRSKDCRRKIACTTCKGRHATVMCDPSRTKSCAAEDAVESINLFSTNKNATSTGGDVLLQTFRVWAVTDSDCCYVRGIIDGGSQRTFVREDVSRRLNLPIIREVKLRLSTFADESPATSQSRKVVRIQLRSQYDQSECTVEAIEIPIICRDMAPIPSQHAFIKELQERGLNLADRVCFPSGGGTNGISVLIGSDQMWKLLKGDVVHSQQNEATVAISTTFGWTLQGPVVTTGSLTENSTSLICVLRTAVDIEDDTSVALRQFWELEHIGITSGEKQEKGRHELIEGLEKTISFKDGRYQVNLPFKEESSGLLHDNRATAYKRLQGLTRKLQRTPDLLEQYDKAIRTYLEDGHAEKVPLAECHLKAEKVYYMPHRPVFRETSTTRLRIVFDASSHGEGQKSLNDFLEKGPNMIIDLVELLVRFRLHRIALTADVRKAFLQIGIKNADRDYLRFLWFADVPTSERGQTEPEVWRMTRVPFGTTASPFLLAATIARHVNKMEEEFPETAAILRTCMYVDDLITGADSLEEAKRIHLEAVEIMQRAGMILGKWVSNSKELEDVFGPPTEEVLTLGKTQETKVLGVVWHRSEDRFKFDPSSILEFLTEQRNTKRFVLQASARIFDPLGLLSPFVVRVKILFQKLWELGVNWDQELPCDLLTEWNSWCNDVPRLSRLSVPRCVIPTAEDEGYTLQIHIFTDASPSAYGAAVYLRVKTDRGNAAVALLTAKARVAPIKRLTLPRLELMGALLGARLKRFSAGIFSCKPVQYYLWTDSTVTLCWIQSSASKWKPFVSNRVAEIQSLTDPARWRHCPGLFNPADLVTRGISADSLVTSTLWWEGPPWLRESEEFWPRSKSESDGMQTVTKEEERKASTETESQLTLQVSDVGPLIELEKYSTLSRALRVTGWILRFIHRCKRINTNAGPLTAEELHAAELHLILEAQRDAYLHDIKKLRQGRAISRQSKLLELNPFIDEDGVLRMKSRLENAELGAATVHPIILPSDHSFTELLVTSLHRRVLHGGVLDTMAEIRDRFWIPRCRQVVKKRIRNCGVCRRQKLKAASASTAPLPSDRVTRDHPFTVVGVDFAGPLYVKAAGGETKSYVALFTCAVTRAVHLEVVSNLTTVNFVMALRRFVSRRGLPQVIYSDNALTFRRAAKDIRGLWELLTSPAVRDFCSSHLIRWKFIVERAAWWGGWWERLVRTIKTSLRKTLGRSRVNYEELETILQEVEGVVNSRPLTTMSAEVSEMEPLTPAHFLIGRRVTTFPSLSDRSIARTPNIEDLRRRLAHRRRVVDHFWNRWHREYLLQLRSAHLSKPKENSVVKVGDAVLVYDNNTPKLNWKMARVCELYYGRDGKVRACEIQLGNGRRLKRALQHLYPLEMSDAHSGGVC